MVALTVALALGIWAADQPDPNSPVFLLFTGGVALMLIAMFDRLRRRESGRWLLAAIYLAWFAGGMLINSLTAINAEEVDETWAKALTNFEGDCFN